MCLDFPWPLRRILLGEQVDHMTYATSSNTYVLGTSQKVDFKLPEDDELHTEWGNEGKGSKTSTLHSGLTLLQ
jgi:cleavage and polyadenylation specificity factor subunit 1